MFVRRQGKPFVASTTGVDMLQLNEMIAAGTLTPVVDRTYSPSDAREAFRYLEGGHARRKVVVVVDHEVG